MVGDPLLAFVLLVDLSQEAITTIGVLSIFVLIALSGFFSSSEIAMFSLAPHQVDALLGDGRKGSKTLKQLKDNPHRLLVTILVGNNIVNIAMSSIATALFGLYLTQGQAVLAATFGITALVLLFGEAAPKSYAVDNTESWALRIARPLKYSEYLLYPLVILFDYLTRVVNKVTGGRSAIESTYVSRSEIRDMIETGERAGVLEEEERDMLDRIFRFNSTIAKEVMTPRLDMTAVSVEDSVEEALQTAIQSSHARLPVFETSLDNVIGVVHVRDLVRDAQYGENAHDLELADLMEPTLHVPESKNVDELLTQMREERVQMAIVIDEFGTTEGLVTMEDMVEEIVGEILEGGEEIPIEEIDEHTVRFKGEVNIEDVNEALDVEIPEGEEFETLAGFIFNRAGRLVEEGEEITYENLTIRVEQVENTRIMKVRVEKEPEAEEDEGENGADGNGDETADEDAT